MVRDRLAEFRRKARIPSDIDGNEDIPRNCLEETMVTSINGSVAIEMQRLDSELDRVFNQVGALKKMIDDLKSDVDKVKSLHSKILTTLIQDERNKSELDDLMSRIKTSTQIIRANLKDLEKVDENDNEKGSADRKVRKIQHSALQRNFIVVLHDYQQAQTEYRDRCKARIKRQLEITGSTVSEEDVEEMIEQGKLSVFTQGLIMETEQARQMLDDVKARHDDILKLEKSLLELHDLFAEIAFLVESQGEIIDNIEIHVTEAQNYVDEAKENIKQAKTWQEKARKKKIKMFIILIIIAIILALIITSAVCKSCF